MNKKNFIAAFKHLNTVLTHKKWVFYYCCKAGIPFRGLVHDLSKFSPTEFGESIKYYTGTHSPIDECKKKNGVSYAWMHHKGRNSHHYEYWQDNFDKGTDHIKMPYKCAIEMICDYLGAGKAYQKDKFTYAGEYEWWLKKKDTANAMHPQTKLFVNYVLLKMSALEREEENPLTALNKRYTKSLYRHCEKMYRLSKKNPDEINLVHHVTDRYGNIEKTAVYTNIH